jgi:hypothetical protein
MQRSDGSPCNSCRQQQGSRERENPEKPRNPKGFRVFSQLIDNMLKSCYNTFLTGAKMKKVYIVKVQGWGDDENAFENVSAHSTRLLAEDAMHVLIAEAHDDGLLDVVTDIEEITLQA